MPILDAKITIIKIINKDFPKDIIVSSVSFKSINEHFNFEDDDVINNCYKKYILSLSRYHATFAIFNSLPKEKEIDDIGLTLRTIKSWAKRS